MEKIPFNYMLCFNETCSKKSECLRSSVRAFLTTEEPSIKILNPLCYPKDNADCQHFRSNKKITLAWGIKNIFDNINYKTAKSIKADMLKKFSKGTYYRICHEQRPVKPEEQEIIQKIFNDNGVKEAPNYSRLTQEYNW